MTTIGIIGAGKIGKALATQLTKAGYEEKTMNIQQNDNGKRGKFFIEQDGRTVAKMTYSRAGENKIIINHTEVDASLKGKGVGKQLVAKAVLFARERNIKIPPLCPFARSVFEKVSEYQDVL